MFFSNAAKVTAVLALVFAILNVVVGIAIARLPDGAYEHWDDIRPPPHREK